jgi:hypothetical protein
MSLDRKLAWAGLLLGIAALVPALKEAGWAWALLLVVFLLAVGGYLVYSEWSSTRTAVTVLSLEKKVVIRDREGINADLIRTQKIRVNQGWLHEYWFRNMVADGAFGPFTIDGEPPAQESRLGCLVSYSKRFHRPLAKGTVREVKLECTARDCFRERHEGLLHDCAQDTKLLILKVELPADRLCREAGLLLEAAGEPSKELEKPDISGDFRTITATVNNPKPGFTYNLHWKW